MSYSMNITKSRIKILDTFFIAGNRTLFLMSFADAHSIGWSDNITGDLFIDGQLQGQYTFYKEKLIGRKNYDYESYAIIDSKEMIDKNKNAIIEIEFHLKPMEKFTIFEKR